MEEGFFTNFVTRRARRRGGFFARQIAMLLLLLHLFVVTGASAWFDEAHMAMLAIAEKDLTADEVARIEALLELYRDDFKGSTTLISSSVWADHIRCDAKSPFCSGLPRVGALMSLNGLHWDVRLHNPQNMEMNDDNLSLPYKQQGACIQLKRMSRALRTPVQPTKTCPRGPSRFQIARDAMGPDDFESRLRRMMEYRQCNRKQSSLRSNRHDLEILGDAEPKTTTRSRTFYNLMIRMLLHSFGDLHQPLHATRTFFPGIGTDMGGHLITLEYPESWRGPPFTLHQLADGATNEFVKPWPEFTDDDARTKATKLMEEYPPSSFSEEELRVDLDDFEYIAEESFALGKELYRKLLDTKRFSKKDLPVKVSDESLAWVRATHVRRVVQAGYRLGGLVKALVGYLPEVANSCLTPAARRKEELIVSRMQK